MSLLERQSVCEELARRSELAAAGSGQTTFVCGEAGIGKTALINHFLGTHHGTVLRGYCDALTTPHALAPVLEIWAQLTGGEVHTPPARQRVFMEILAYLQQSQTLTIVVLEDLHWADDATLDFIRYLVRRLGSARCLLLASLRDDELGPTHALRRALGDLAGPHVSRVRLAPLTRAAVTQLADSSGFDGSRVFAITGGNPFFVRELLSAPFGTVPETVRDSMMARLSRCSAAAREVSEYCALSPGRLEIDVVSQLRGPSQEAIDECIERGILVHDRGALAYRHELARRAVEDSLPPARTQQWHGRILALLSSLRADIGRVVHHAQRAHDAAAMLLYAPQAARQAAAFGAHFAAAAYCEGALAFAAHLEPAERARLYESHAYECYLTNDTFHALESAQRALEIWRELDDRQAQGRTMRFLSRQYWFQGDRQSADRHSLASIALLEQLPPDRDLAMAYSNRAQLAMLAEDVADAVEFGKRALAIATRVGDVEIECHALNNIGSALLWNEDEAGRVPLERSLELALAHDLHEHASRAYVNLACSAMRVQDNERSRKYLEAGINYSEERDLDTWTAYLHVYQARFDCDRGHWDEALRRSSAYLDSPESMGITRIPALVVHSKIRMRRGQPGVEELLREAMDRALPTAELQRIGAVAAAAAEYAWLCRDNPRLLDAADLGLRFAAAHIDPWLKGELLFWKSRCVEVELPTDIAEPYRHAISGEWRKAADGFAHYRMPYQQALVLLAGDDASLSTARTLIEQLGAAALVERLEEAVQARGSRRSTRENPRGLTNREIEVLRLLTRGLTNAELARQLFVSSKTIDHHVSAILGKLQVRSRAHAVNAAHELGIVART